MANPIDIELNRVACLYNREAADPSRPFALVFYGLDDKPAFQAWTHLEGLKALENAIGDSITAIEAARANAGPPP